jgi:penicillin-binding protein 1A
MPNNTWKKWRSGLLIGFSTLILLLILIGFTFGLIAGCSLDVSRLEEQKLSTVVYGANNKVVTNLFEENRSYITLDKVPQKMKEAFLATEDRKFYEHRGIDVLGIMRALLIDLKVGRFKEGASTITQQLIRQTYLSNERTIARKVREAIYAIVVERYYTKDQIFEKYLNKIYLGKQAYGVQAAARAYLGKDIYELDLAETALIAGLVKAPSVYMNNPEKARERRNIVLESMKDVGYITAEEAKEAAAQPVVFAENTSSRRVAPYFIDYIVQELLKNGISETEIYTGGLKIKTTLDVDIQKAAEEAFKNGLPAASPDSNGIAQPQAALVAIDPHTGHIKAMIGGRDFGNTQLNRAVKAHRQPGSTMKPFVYTAALDNHFTPSMMVVDEPLEFNNADGSKYRPQNYDRTFRGPITLREAIENSVNIVAIKLVDQLGPQTIMKYAQKMGLTSLVSTGKKNDLNVAALALGGLTNGVTPLELASAYTPLANQGIYVEPIAILEVVDSSGSVIYRNHSKKSVVLSEPTAYLMTDLLRGVIERGTGRAANIGRPAAGKTGTTNENTNAWFIGYTPELLSVVWLGNDAQNKPLRVNGTIIGSGTAARIWGNFMRSALSNVPASDFPVPSGVVSGIEICTESGYLASNCPNTKIETFIQGTEPTEECPLHSPGGNTLFETVTICRESGKLATYSCPPEDLETRYFNRATGRELLGSATRPWDYCDVHGPQEITVKICTHSGLLAKSSCPVDSVILQRFIQGEEPTEFCDIH